ncbi:hypothetical protein [Anaerophilus nitritogenes]|uniref:hypothetical protein n=1 Tax=Anaerophilus nitritogenes TaxID=2498136 RepID=UPI00101C2B54|nr:hypothetical protein [Anaerophilus nitritogenes]
MRLRNKIFIIFISTCLGICCVIGILTRQSFYTDVDAKHLFKEIEDFKIDLAENSPLSKIYFEDNIDNLAQLKEKADLIVKVSVTDNRKIFNLALLSNVNVLDIYKGKNIKENDNIYIYEPFSLGINTCEIENGYIPIKKDEEYIFFLKHLKIPNGYKYKGKEKITYIPVSTIFSKYNLMNETNTKPINKAILNNGIEFIKVKNMDILTTNMNILKKYNTLKEQVHYMISKDCVYQNKRVDYP